MSFLTYDLIFLAAFLIFFSVFLYTRKHNLKREGLLFMYRAKWGIKLIDYIGSRYKKTLKALSYISVAMGYLLMAAGVYLVYLIVKIYLFNPAVVSELKVPPIIPLVPYLPQVFNLQFLPPFYFTYWIIIIAVLAIPHEVAHGVMAAYNKVKIKTTGFAFFPYFFPIFPAAFVEPDEKAMEKKSKFAQLTVLSAGTFANIITAVIFILLLMGFFSLAFSPSGVVFDTYSISQVSIAGITMMNGVPLTNPSYNQLLNLSEQKGFNNITYNNRTYLATADMLDNQSNNNGQIVLYDDAPAIENNLSSIISVIDGKNITSISDLQQALEKHKPGDNITITQITDNGTADKTITLGNRPGMPGTPWLGIGFYTQQQTGLFSKVVGGIVSFKSPNVYYTANFGDFSVFIYNLLWWIEIMSITVAIINMLPVGIFDGGRFFYLTVWGITKKEKFAKKAFAFSTWFVLFLIVLLMAIWAITVL